MTAILILIVNLLILIEIKNRVNIKNFKKYSNFRTTNIWWSEILLTEIMLKLIN